MAFAVPAAAGDLVVIGVAPNAESATKTRDASMAKTQPSVMPIKLRLTHDPASFWCHHEVLRYATLSYEAMKQALQGDMDDRHKIAWMARLFTDRLYSNDLVVSAGWSRKLGFRLRYMF